MKYLAGKPGRFLYVHTPKHSSWLNLVETLFGKMARTFLKHIRVNSKQELKERILMGIKEIMFLLSCIVGRNSILHMLSNVNILMIRYTRNGCSLCIKENEFIVDDQSCRR